jgi:hypothetical protein
MKILKQIPLWARVFILLMFANLAWMSWNVYQNADLRGVTKRFKVEMLQTNDASGIGLFERKTDQPLWAEWDFKGDSKTIQENYFFHGRDVFDIYLDGQRPPRYTVFFPGLEKSGTWWLDRGGAESFTERIFYETNGVPSKHEVWYDNSWCPVDRHNEKNGIVINGQWHQLVFDTNGMWTIKAP